ncbi:DMT family transporter [Flavobacterium glaciei]|uniref:Threonine/homoserine efflux transporter RhtA n=1 Tax=Flavobacterium glaciei TaxID=386300 RepID=A0A562Q5P2_9FLAO|nr:DMT family transporter [Flavobacterium glaciei]RDI58272.1 threonine/homoserine efflux transporter RhtA [Flavobacterium glaciei]TWI52059.1 threonine/homoserine efflux transporter RhtA [Flavobacterium glaciei]
MIKNSVLKGVFLVGLGATSYGMLATFVRMAYDENYTTAEVTVSQFVFGIIGILLINAFQRNRNNNTAVKASKKNKSQLMLAGTSTGLTSVFYYLAVKFDIPVSIAIVLLMQTVWIGVLLEWFLEKKAPSKVKTISVIIVLFGTVLATNLLNSDVKLNPLGIFFGLLAATSFTTTMFTANRIATEISSAQRSLYMLFGGGIMVLIFALITQIIPNQFPAIADALGVFSTAKDFNFSIFLKWGIILSLFGTIIPPMLLNAGFPLTGIGLGSIVSALELPVSVLMAYFLLNEKVILLQWVGIVLIILAIVIMNVNFKKKA